ncbi:hypothetical protein [Sutcliffiella horikoshii]|uniref:hypothetical protein n=1 Tax=Sutcliffiella horikoshii TaxID=79883 RepID=UPI00384C5A9A
MEIYYWEDENLIDTIEDKGFIKEHVQNLENAKTHSTASIDWVVPDNMLLFKHNNEVLYEIGYCKEIKNFGRGAMEKYWEFDKLYEIGTKLPV